MKRTRRMKQLLMFFLLLAGMALAAPGLALEPAPPENFAPAADEAQRVAEALPAAPVTEPNEGIAPPLIDDFETEPTIPPVDTVPPKIDSAQFGVGWPAAVAVGVALLAVLAMALVWRRDEVA